MCVSLIMEKFTIFLLIVIYCPEVWSFSCYFCNSSECQHPPKIDCAGKNIRGCYSMRYSRDMQNKGCVDENFPGYLCDKMNRRLRLNVSFNSYCLRCLAENCNICKHNDVCTKEVLNKLNQYENTEKPNKGMSCYECSGPGDYCEYEFGTSRVVTCYEGECFVMQNKTHFMQGCVTESMLGFSSICDQIDFAPGEGYCKICNNTQNCNQRFIYDPKYDPKKFNLQYTKNTTNDDNKLKCYNCSKISCETQHFSIEVCDEAVRECYIMYRNNIPYKMGCNTNRLTLEKCRDTKKHQYCTTCDKNYCNSSIIITNFNLIILFLSVFYLLKI